MYSKGEDSPGTSPPKDSSTVILTRDKTEGQYEIFLMRRHRKQVFMGGAFVFPGGKLDEDDCDLDLVRYSRGFSPEEAKERLREPGLSDEKVSGIFFAAVRETFEEAGVLLAYTAKGRLMDFADDEVAERFSEYRLNIYRKGISLKELARRENLHYALDLLIPYSHWITPEIESKRYDTRFLLARVPRGQSPVHCSIEMTESMWITPTAALEQHESGEILLMPPTLKTVLELNEFDSTDQLFAAADSRDIYAILPQPFPVTGGFGVKLPHDPEYDIAGYRQPPRPNESSRIVLQDGKWRTLDPINPDFAFG